MISCSLYSSSNVLYFLRPFNGLDLNNIEMTNKVISLFKKKQSIKHALVNKITERGWRM